MNRYVIAAVAVSILVLNACGSSKDASKANFKTAVQAYLNTKPGVCVPLPSKEMPFQIEKSGGLDARTAVQGEGRLTQPSAATDADSGARGNRFAKGSGERDTATAREPARFF